MSLTSVYAHLYASALAGASMAAGGQNYPPGALYVVATPIGNLADISLRALHVLQLADTIACEDTRHTQALLRAYGIEKTSAQLLAVHQHNESQAAQVVIERLQQGERVAYASDAGTRHRRLERGRCERGRRTARRLCFCWFLIIQIG